MKLSKLQEKSEVIEAIKNIIETIAIILAGCWTYFNFIKTEYATTESSIYSEGKISIDSFDNHRNMVTYKVSVQNASKSIIDVDSVVVKYWLIPIDTMAGVNSFNTLKLANSLPARDSDIQFFDKLTPQTKFYQSSNFLISNVPDFIVLCTSTTYARVKHTFYKDESLTAVTSNMMLRNVVLHTKNEE